MSATLTEVLTVISTLLSPVIAIQVSEYIQTKKIARSEKLSIFKTLMETRATRLDPRHVEALNLIDVTFGNTNAEREIRDTWKAYLDHLSTDSNSHGGDQWFNDSTTLLVDLLSKMGKHLGFQFDKTHIKNQGYYPKLFGGLQENMLTTRGALENVLTGKATIKVQLCDSQAPK